jgi:hypothetical protein
MSDDQTFADAIEGYCGSLSYQPGQPVSLHISTTAERFSVTVQRWGADRQTVWSAVDQPGQHHLPPADADAQGCRWPETLTIPTTTDWESGFYLVTLEASEGPEDDRGGRVNHAGFVLRAGDRRNRAVLVLATNTWNAYNTWGGRSLYTGGHQVSFARPFARGMLHRPTTERDDRKARPVYTGETPDIDGVTFQQYRTDHNYPSAIGSTGWFTHERRFVEWAEALGYRFDYLISSDLDTDPHSLDGYDVVIGVGHDEYWSADQRQRLDEFGASGGDVVSLSGNTMFWQVRLTDTAPGLAMICHKYRAHLDDPVMGSSDESTMTGMWADPVVGQPEWSLLGAGSAYGLYARFGAATPRGVGGFVIYRSDHWMLDGTNLGYGDVLGRDDGIVGYETVGCPIQLNDIGLPEAAPRPDLPAECTIVAFTPTSNLRVGQYPKSIAALSDQGDAEFIAERVFGGINDENLARAMHGNAVMMTSRPWGASGGTMTVCGSTDWVFGLSDPQVAQVTANILNHSLTGER